MQVRKLLGRTVSIRIVLVLLIVFLIVGFLVGSLGSGDSGTTTSVPATFNPRAEPLSPGQTRTFTVVIRNPEDYMVRVASISEGSSEATPGGCPAGTITTAPVANPSGAIAPQGVNAYQVTARVTDELDERCPGESFVVPLTVELKSAAADR